MENQNQTGAPDTSKAPQIVVEKLMIKRISFAPITKKNGEKVNGVVVHTKPSSALNKPKAGENESRFRLTLVQFENIAKGCGYDDTALFAKDCIGGNYEVAMERVKAGDTWTSPNGATGVYSKDGFGNATRKIELSTLVVEEDRLAHRNAYYMHKYSAKKSVAPVSGVAGGNAGTTGEDIDI
jgi:hypothetical protein